MTNRRLYFINAHPGGNLGAEGMLTTVVTKLLSWSEIRENFDFWFETINESNDYATFVDSLGLPGRFFRFEPRRLGAPYHIDANSSDIVIDIGGIAYHGGNAKANLRNYRRHRFFASRGAKMVFFTQDFGPTEDALTRFLARRALAPSRIVFSRSQRSKTLLEQIVPSATVTGPYPDCTFALEPETPTLPIRAEKYAVIVPSAIMWNTHGVGYLDLLEAIATQFPDDHVVVILSHNFTPNGGTSDTEVCKQLAQRLQGRRDTLLHVDKRPATELKAILADATAVVTSRFHALVGAMSGGTPAFAIGWNHKYEEFLAPYQMKDRSLAMDDIPQDPSLLAELACDIVSALLERTDRSEISAVNATTQKQVEQSFSELRHVLSD